MSGFQRIVVNFAGSAVAIEVEDARAAEIVKFLIHPNLINDSQTPHCTFRVLVSNNDPVTYSLTQNDVLSFQSTSPGNLAEMLQGEVCRQLADKSQGGLLFHAAALLDKERGILIPGGIGAGKSTLTTWLLSKGLSYLTDELVYIAWGSNEIQPYPRPLHLKHPSRSVLASMALQYDHLPTILSSTASDMVPAAVFTSQQITHPVPLELVLFPAYQTQTAGTWQQLSPAQIGQACMQTLINARNLPDHGFHETARLARQVQGYAFQYSHFNQIEASLADILSFK